VADHSAYRAALEPWAKKAERERKVIEHVRWTNGYAEVTLRHREKGTSPTSEAGAIL
jgi:hypothetical protein